MENVREISQKQQDVREISQKQQFEFIFFLTKLL